MCMVFGAATNALQVERVKRKSTEMPLQKRDVRGGFRCRKLALISKVIMAVDFKNCAP